MLLHKFKRLAKLAMGEKEITSFVARLENIGQSTNEELESIYECKLQFAKQSIDAPLDSDSDEEKS